MLMRRPGTRSVRSRPRPADPTPLQQSPKHALLEGCVRRVGEARVWFGVALQDRLGVAEDSEAGYAVVGAHAAGAHATEGEVEHRDVPQGVIDRHAPC